MAKQLNENGFKRLRRYFQGKTVVLPDKEKGSVKLRSVDPRVTAYNSYWKPSSMGQHGNYSHYLSYRAQPYHRIYMFREYQMMEKDPIIARALDILSEESCLENEYGEVLDIECDNDDIKITLEHLFYEVLNINFTLRGWVRGMLKFGDFFLYLNIKEKLGVVDAIPLQTAEVEREEDEDTGEVTFSANEVFSSDIPEERMAHFRLTKDNEFLPYGVSHLEPVRKYWKMMTLLEDFMMVYYLLRSVNQRVFRVDVGGLSRPEAEKYVQQVREMFKKQPLVDEETGEYDLKYDPLTMIDDIVLPVRQGYDNTTFDEIPASTETDIVSGIDYLRQKIMAGLGVPNFLLNYEETINSKSTASSEDIRFAKTVEGIQKIIVDELEKIAVIHLILQGYSKREIFSFDISLTPPSDLKEMEKLEKIRTRLELARDAKDAELLDSEWIYKNIMGFGDDEIEDIRQGIVNDKISQQLEEKSIEQAVSEPEAEGAVSPEGGETPSPEADTGEEGGEGSQGGLEPEPTQDDVQQNAPSNRVDQLLKSRETNDEPNRESRDGEREEER